MDVSDLDNNAAKRILKKMCKAISIRCGTDVVPNYYSDGYVNIISADEREIINVIVPNDIYNTLYFNSAKGLIASLLTSGTILNFSPLGKDSVVMDTSKLFGRTLEELLVNLDLMKV